MAEVELECAVYGEGTVFPVKIARDAKVSALQEVIAGILSAEQHAVPPRLLTLYLARKNGAWLKDDDKVDAFLKGEVDKQLKKMRPTWNLDDEEYFGEDFKPGRKEIHVLVELPERHQTVVVPDQVPNEATAFDHGLYVREEYWELHDMIDKELKSLPCRRILVVGSPGIGKSVFGLFLLLLAIKERKNVAYHPLGNQGTYYITWKENGQEISNSPCADRTYDGYFDGKECGEALNFNVYDRVFLFASPRSSNFNEFKKEKCLKIYMNPWARHECREFANVIELEDQDEWLQRFKLFDDLQKDVEREIPQTLNELKDQVLLFERGVFDDRMKHLVFNLYRSNESLSRFYLAFASLFVEATVDARYQTQSADQIRSLLQTPASNLQSWRGKQIEILLLQDLATKVFQTRVLEGRNTGTLKRVGPFNAKCKIIQALSDIQVELRMCIPLSKIFAAIDAVFVIPQEKRIIYVQSTVSDSHPIKYIHLKKAYEELKLRFPGYEHLLLFIVSSDVYDHFKKQPYKNADV
ncbi:hypothetical protein GQ600_12150 [Phytophthora cactorum]|nr:hypothetical protein GQ600_12150 [Phytophthora cactorum]